jgi:hypothetical protein
MVVSGFVGSTKMLLMVELRDVSPWVGAPAGPLWLTPLLCYRGGVCMLYYSYPLMGVNWDRFWKAIWGEFVNWLEVTELTESLPLRICFEEIWTYKQYIEEYCT